MTTIPAPATSDGGQCGVGQPTLPGVARVVVGVNRVAHNDRALAAAHAAGSKSDAVRWSRKSS